MVNLTTGFDRVACAYYMTRNVVEIPIAMRSNERCSCQAIFGLRGASLRAFILLACS
jgi:hypothetical protein